MGLAEGQIFCAAGPSDGGCSVPHVLTPSSTHRAGYLPASFALRDDDSEEASIVGLWQVTFTSKDTPGIPDGTVVDAGFATWHADGTEIMNSGRPPITGNFCMGVWKQVRRPVRYLRQRARPHHRRSQRPSNYSELNADSYE